MLFIGIIFKKQILNIKEQKLVSDSDVALLKKFREMIRNIEDRETL